MTDGRTLVVTGATHGLGRHIAMEADKAGYRVIGLARSEPDEDDFFEFHRCDVSDHKQVKAVFKNFRPIEGLYGLVNAAGIASMNLFLSTPPDTMDRIIATNLLGTMYCSQAMGKHLARKKHGRIINFSSIAVHLGLKGEAAYVASKCGIEGFTRSFAREMADFNVTVNTIAPGPIMTTLIKNVPQENIDKIVETQVIPRMATPQDVWDIVSLLLEDRAGMITAQTINIGGS